MQIKFLLILIIGLGILFNKSSFGQFHDKKEGGGFPDPQLSQKDNDYLDRQAKVFLDTVQVLLDEFPPSEYKSRERGFAMLLMDAVFHEHYAAFREPSQSFYHARINQVIEELENTSLKDGAKVWKLYNMGFIIRTPSVTMAFDVVSGITSGSVKFALNESQVNKIVEQCDVLFISHRHEDHGEKSIAESFLQKGLPVFAPKQIWKNDPIQSKIINPERIAHKARKLSVNGKKIELVTYPGHQMSGIDCNVYLVKTEEGIVVSHTGDQINEGDFMVDYEWIDKVKEHYEVDIFMPSAWTMDIFRIVKGFNPRLVLPSHELELGHTVWDRLPFWGDDEYLQLNYADLKESNYDVRVLLWGESVDFIRNSKIP